MDRLHVEIQGRGSGRPSMSRRRSVKRQRVEGKGARMNRAANLLRAVAFVLSSVISAGVFGGFAVWALSTLDPATQEVIGLVSAPWFTTPAYSKLTRAGAGRVVDRGSESSPSPVARRP